MNQANPSPLLDQDDSNFQYAIRHWDPEPKWYTPMISQSVINVSKIIMGRLNTINWIDQIYWDLAMELYQVNRQQGIGLLSFSNHVSLFDDPLLISNLGLSNYEEARWIPTDHINFFGNALKGFIYSAGKCVPIVRGGGLNQPGFDFLLNRLREGCWVHIFPEGGRTRREEGRLKTPFKMGIGRLIDEAQPLLLPFYHHGMHSVMPIGSWIPRIGKTVHVQFSQPRFSNDLDLSQISTQSKPDLMQSSKLRWQAYCDWAYQSLYALEQALNPSDSSSI